MAPYISILIPLYNGIEFLQECLQSVVNQTFHSWEAIIGVNGHGSNGGEVASQALDILASLGGDSRIRMIVQGSEKGKVESLNSLLGEAKGDWIAILDCDDVWHSEKLQKQVDASFTAGRDAAILGTQCQYFGELYGKPQIPHGYILPAQLASLNPIINSSCLIRRDVCMKLQWRYTDICYGMEDYDFWMRADLAGHRLYNLSESLVFHRIHSSSAFNTKSQDPKALQEWYIDLRTKN